MKKLLLSSIAGLVLTSNIAMALDIGNGNWYYSPKRYVKSYLFSIDIMGQKIKNSDLGFEMGLSSRYINYFGNSDFNWGVLGNIEFSGIKPKDKNNLKLRRANLDIGPTIGYNITKKTNLYATAGYSGYYMIDSDKNYTWGINPYYGGGISYFFNDDIVLSLSYKIKNIDKNNYWGLQENQNQLNFGLKITYR